MLRGLVQQFDAYEWKAELLESELPMFGPAPAQTAASTQSVWAPTQSSVDVAVALGVRRRKISSLVVHREYELEIPALGVSETWSDPTDAFVLVTELKIVDYLQVFQEPNGSWRVRLGGLEWWAGGAMRWSTGPAEILGPWSATAGIPLIGCPVGITATASSGIAALYPPVLSLEPIDRRAEALAGGGTRFKLRGESDWVALPVRLDRSASAIPCVGGEVVLLSGTSTWNLEVRAIDGLTQAVGDITETTVPCPSPCTGPGFLLRQGPVIQDHFAAGGQTVWAFPDLQWAIERGVPDGFAEMVERGGMPGVVRLTTTSIGDCTEEGLPGATVEDILLPSQSGILSTIGQSPHPCEDTLGHTVYAPASLFVRQTHAGGYLCDIVRSGCSAPLGWGGDCYTTDLCEPLYDACCGIWSYAPWVEGLADNPHLLHRWHHPAPGDPEDPMSWLIRLVNYWGSRLHQYSSWFPPDLDEEPESPVEWRLYGDRANPADYWGPIGQQWTWHPALPESERRRTRLDLASEMVGEGYGAVEAYRTWGRHGAYVGASRFKAVSASIPATWTYGASSSPLWTCPGATLTFGASGVTVNADGAGAGTVVLSVDLASVLAAPYWFGLICAAFEVDWSATNIAGVTVRLLGADGTSVTLGTNPGTYPRAVGSAIAYAGDWGREYSPGFDPLDIGTDSLPAGESATVAGIVERLAGLQLLPGRSAERLEFVLDIVDRAIDVFVEYPVLHAPAGTPWMRPLAHRLWALLWPSGAGVEIGGARFWDDVGDAFIAPGSDPVVDALDRPTTILDALCLRRMLFEARAWDDGLTAEIEAEWLADWEYPIGLARKHAARSPVGDTLVRRTRSWWHHYGRPGDLIVACAANTYREVPPSIVLPVRRREIRDLVPDGALGGWTYAWAQEPRYHIANPGTSIELALSGSTWTSAVAPVPAGWLVSKHTHAVDNEEGAVASLRWNGLEYAQLTPWHGYFGTFWEDVGAEGVANAHGPFGHYWRADVVGGRIRVSRSPVAIPPFDGSALVTSGTDSSPSLAWSASIGELWLAWVRGTELRVAVSRDRGRTFGGETVMAAQARSPRVFGSRSGWRVLAWFWHNSGTSGPGRIRIRVAPPRGDMAAAITLPFDVEDVGLDGSIGDHALDPWILTAVPEGETAPAEWMSNDRGATWRRIT
jgi:hypothetical protein